jgi:hypothetical protein
MTDQDKLEIIYDKWDSISEEEKSSMVDRWISEGHLQEYYYEQGYTDDEGVIAEENTDYDKAEEIFFEEHWFPAQFKELSSK